MSWWSAWRRLSKTQYKTLLMVKRYVEETGRECFTYNDILRYWQRSEIRINANTLERRLRELASYGYLRRAEKEVGGRRRRVFCLDHPLS